MKRRDVIAVALAAAFAGTGSAAMAQSSLAGKTITIIFPFAAGGSGDASIRLIADKLRQSLGATIIVDNKAGGAGRIGVMAVKGAKPDGLTLLYSPFAAMSIYQHSYKDLGYDPFKDFVPVSLIGSFDFGLAVNPSNPAKSPGEFIEWLKKNPSQTSYGSPGAGTLPHFMGVSLAKQTGLPLTHATYRGSAAAMSDLIGGHVPFVFTTMSDLVPHAKTGKIRILGTSDTKRSFATPDVPTFKEAGINLEGVGWYGMFAPAGTPPAVIAEINKAVVEAAKAPDVREKFLAMGLMPEGTSAEALAKQQKADSDRWKPVIDASGYTPEQ
ncbi:MAG: Bug family tripartite tricarboxylate transporter substrate binding protein [Proteobacteria bacterium]|nr:Bug family tripartite tricarboxylate transporter substrate binding protein [Pseudomonadota bacterium]